jgi:hypothetical protein
MTALQEIRLIIADKDGEEFQDSEIMYYYNVHNSINFAVYKLIGILIFRLRKQLLESDTTGTEKTDLAPLRDRLKLLENLKNEYKSLYDSENDNSCGRYISTVKPTIAGGDT